MPTPLTSCYLIVLLYMNHTTHIHIKYYWKSKQATFWYDVDYGIILTHIVLPQDIVSS